MNSIVYEKQMNAEHTRDMDLLVKAVRRAGEIGMSYFGNSPDETKKSDGTPVSEADLAIDKYLKETLLCERAAYGWLSEETEDDRARLNCNNVWIVDPIDGTRAFLQQKPEWAVSVALVADGLPVLACVFNPARDEFYQAVHGQGALLNGEKISVSPQSEIAGCRMVSSPSMFRARYWPESWPEMNVFWANSVAYRLALVAAGKADATISLTNKSDWDVAAADLIVREAGGLMTNHMGDRMRYNAKLPLQLSVLAANPALHGALLKRTSLVEQRQRR